VTGLSDWPRPFYDADAPGDRPFVVIAVFGSFAGRSLDLSKSRHRVAGPPAGLAVDIEPGALFREALEAPLIRTLYSETEPYARAAAAPEAMLIRGEPDDPSTLNYLRDTAGLVVAALEAAGGEPVAMDLNGFLLRTPEMWRNACWAPEEGDPHAYVHVFAHPDGEDELLTTRGLRTFGRPDIAFPGVAAAWRDEAVEVVQRLITTQARGGVAPEGQPIGIAGAPEGFVVRHAAAAEDPTFNNRHIRIVREGS